MSNDASSKGGYLMKQHEQTELEQRLESAKKIRDRINQLWKVIEITHAENIALKICRQRLTLSDGADCTIAQSISAHNYPPEEAQFSADLARELADMIRERLEQRIADLEHQYSMV